jgi:hypothetical protein
MRHTLAVCAVVFALGSMFSVRAEATDPSVSRGKAMGEGHLAAAGYDGRYRRSQTCGYYIYACRAWWAGCGWEGPFSFPLNRYWGYRYLCW